MTDIVEELRALAMDGEVPFNAWSAANVAANNIEQLRAALASIRCEAAFESPDYLNSYGLIMEMCDKAIKNSVRDDRLPKMNWDACSTGGLWVCADCGESYCSPPWSGGAAARDHEALCPGPGGGKP